MSPRITEVWVYLSATPLLGLTLTLVVYQAAVWLSARCRQHPLVNPVLISILVLGFTQCDRHAVQNLF